PARSWKERRLNRRQPPAPASWGKLSPSNLPNPVARSRGYFVRAPKSAVMIVTPRPWYVPGAESEWTADRPTSRHDGFRRFARCSGLPIHILIAPAASTSGDDQRRF